MNEMRNIFSNGVDCCFIQLIVIDPDYQSPGKNSGREVLDGGCQYSSSCKFFVRIRNDQS